MSADQADVAAIEDVEEAMRDVVDPELGINVVDLGLVYDIRVEAADIDTRDITAHHVCSPPVDPDWVRSELPADDLSAPLNPPFLSPSPPAFLPGNPCGLRSHRATPPPSGRCSRRATTPSAPRYCWSSAAAG